MCSQHGKKICILTVFGICGVASFLLLASVFQQEVIFKNPRKDGGESPNDEYRNLLYVLQVSDIHVSRHFEPSRIADFGQFCNKTIPLIDPELILITGDLTDAKTSNKLGSFQYSDEWLAYSSVVDTIKQPLIHIRGNHDAFNEPKYNDSFFVKHGGDRVARNSLYEIKKPFGRYSFVAVDAASEPGFKRPFNFVGYIKEKGVKELEQIGQEAKGSNHSIWFGHYPTSTMYHATSMRQLFSDYSTAYLCGHLHDGAGKIRRMQHLHQNGLAELELADWKHSRIFRILSFDHDIFSFTDFSWRKSSIFIHITHPPNWQLTNPEKQPIDRIQSSTHVRALIFSETAVEKVHAIIDGKIVDMVQVNTSNLWTAPWSPRSDEPGEVIIVAVDTAGRHENVSNIYNLHYDRITPSKFSPLGTFILSVDFCVYFGFAFWIGSAIPLLFMFLMSPIFAKITGRQALRLSWSFLLRFQILFGRTPYCTHLSYPLMLWTCWIMFLPWFLGRVINDVLGMVSVWGIVYEGQLHMSHEIYAAGFWDIVSFLWPSLLYCSYFSERLWSDRTVRPDRSFFNMIFFLLVVIVFLVRINTVFQISSSYGMIAGCLSPVYTLPPIFTLYSSYFIFFKK